MNNRSIEDDERGEVAKDSVQKILDSFPNGVHRIDEFNENITSIVEGYISFLNFSITEKDRSLKISSAKIFEKWNKFSEDENHIPFKELYEFVNVRTYTEAICETIGSMMAIAVSNGRNLQPFNLDKEVFIKFNLPPLHNLGEFTTGVAKKWREGGNLEFYRKCKPKEAISNLKLKELSSSLII